MNRLLITGTRKGWDHQILTDALTDALLRLGTGDGTVLVHGAAPGVDRQAAYIWKGWGLEDEPHPAQWEAHGKAAGPIRNQEMVDLGADLCLAFIHPDSVGTVHCARIAEAAGIPVERFTP